MSSTSSDSWSIPEFRPLSLGPGTTARTRWRPGARSSGEIWHQIYSNYAATETGRIGFQCEKRKGYHFNIDFTAVRLVDESGQDVPAGEVGEVIVSNLHNTATVLLNYRLGDLAEMSAQDCPCGRNLPLLRELHGRVWSPSSSPTAGESPRGPSGCGSVTSFVKSESADRRPGARPHAPGNCPGRGTERQAFKKQLLEHSARVFGSQLEASVEFVDDIPTASSGKFEAVKLTVPGGRHLMGTPALLTGSHRPPTRDIPGSFALAYVL